ncbi:unnamed protein product [Ilex paraguariensis]|uniref:Uncharacterized protein n=1 Tax=Ilex paraguariensis TaxID=185542 RepID=A0ABC8RYF8_9AQUA
MLYITFKAQDAATADGEDDSTKIFQALVCRGIVKNEVDFCRLKPKPSHSIRDLNSGWLGPKSVRLINPWLGKRHSTFVILFYFCHVSLLNDLTMSNNTLSQLHTIGFHS